MTDFCEPINYEFFSLGVLRPQATFSAAAEPDGRTPAGNVSSRADVAQLVEQLPCKQQVTSSSLVIGPIAGLRGPARQDDRRDTEAVKRGRL